MMKRKGNVKVRWILKWSGYSTFQKIGWVQNRLSHEIVRMRSHAAVPLFSPAGCQQRQVYQKIDADEMCLVCFYRY